MWGFGLKCKLYRFQIGLSTAAEKLKNDNKLKYILVIGTYVQSPLLIEIAETSIFWRWIAAAVVGKFLKVMVYIAAPLFVNYAYDDKTKSWWINVSLKQNEQKKFCILL